MKVTEHEVRELVAKAATSFDAHRQLEDLRYDLDCDDGRAREGLGLTSRPPSINAEAEKLLDQYLSEN